MITTTLNNIPVSFQTITEVRIRTTTGSLRHWFSPSPRSLFDPARMDTDYAMQGSMPLQEESIRAGTRGTPLGIREGGSPIVMRSPSDPPHAYF
ncbi:MAG: hypothetical protein STSR0009_22670 [Methanoregula sp.]